MDHSLINPNRVWMAGIPVSDSHFYDNLKLGITHEKVLISYGNYEKKVYFYSGSTTQY